MENDYGCLGRLALHALSYVSSWPRVDSFLFQVSDETPAAEVPISQKGQWKCVFNSRDQEEKENTCFLYFISNATEA